MPLIRSSSHEGQNTAVPALRDGVDKRPVHHPAMPYADASANGRNTGSDSDGLDQYWRMLSRRKATLLLAAILGALLGFLLTRVQSPVYRARALIELVGLNEDFLNMRQVSPTAVSDTALSPEYTIRTQSMVLKSRPVVERAMEKLELEKR